MLAIASIVLPPLTSSQLYGQDGAVSAEESRSRLRRSPGSRRAGSRYYNTIPSYDGHPFNELHVNDGWLLDRDYWQWKNRLWQERGFTIGGYYSANVLFGDQDGKAHAVSENIMLMTWEAVRSSTHKESLIVGFAHDQTLGSLTTREFADQQGLVETPDDLDTDPDPATTTLALALWEHQSFLNGQDEGWGLRLGQLFAAQYFALAEYLNDDRRYLIARPLAGAAAVQWIGTNDIGLGVQLAYWRKPFWVSAAVMDGNGSQRYPDFRRLFDGKGLLVIGEIGLERDLGGPNEAAVRITASHIEPTGELVDDVAGQALAVSAYQTFDDEWVFFTRWNKSFRRLNSDYEELFSLGAGSVSPGKWSEDFVAAGLWFGKPSDRSKGTEHGVEINYRLQLTQALRVTPDIQFWNRRDPGSSTHSAIIWGMRMTAEY